MYYNFVRIHQTLKVSPAMAAGVTIKLWEVSDIVEMLEVGTGELQAGISIRGPAIRHREGAFGQRSLARGRSRYDFRI
jgi:hypothetical protein